MATLNDLITEAGLRKSELSARCVISGGNAKTRENGKALKQPLQIKQK